jgi:uncharacterized delta-60 repeat protein
MKNLLSMFCLAIAASAFAQDGTLDTTFNVGTGFDQTVGSIVIQPDGKIIASGGFSQFNGAPSSYIARLNTDGSLDTTFNFTLVLASAIEAVALQSDNKIIVGGNLTNGNIKRIGRLNTDGSVDTTFNIPGTGFDGPIYSIAVQADGKILTAGNFTDFNGRTIGRGIARLNTNGSLDTTFNVGGAGLANFSRSVSVQADGRIIVAGAFVTFNGISRSRIVRLNSDGTSDASFNIGTGFNDFVYTAKIQPDGKILAVGDFTSFNGTSRVRVARLNADGTLDTTFDNPTFSDRAISIGIQADGKVFVGGYFTVVGSRSVFSLARLNTNGSLDTTFNDSVVNNNGVAAIAIQSDGKVLTGGLFSNNIARYLFTTIVGVSENMPNAAVTFDVYPNPTNATVSVSLPDALLGQKISLLNSIGQVLETKNINATTISYDLANLANGIYFIQVQTNKGIATKKVVKH